MVESSDSSSSTAAWFARFATAAALAFTAGLPTAHSAGVEVGESTTLSTARGGTGVASKTDPSAIYFNPAMLGATDGFQILTDIDAIDFNLKYDRDDLVYERGGEQQRRSYRTVQNVSDPFFVPSIALSWDAGIENLGLAIGLFAPHSYGERCFGYREGGDCKRLPWGAARHMLVHSNLIEVYAMAGIGYQVELPNGTLGLGASGMFAYQDNEFTLVINSERAPNPPWEEDPRQEAVFTGRDLTDWNLNAILGVFYQQDGLRLAASYRPPMKWDAQGRAEVDFPRQLDDFDVRLSDDRVRLETWQAGSLRLGWAYEHGTHPGHSDRPLYDLEVNGVWEDWSRVEEFVMTPSGDIVSDRVESLRTELRPISQPKNWRDTFSLRAGGSWGALSWLTLHGGGFLETAAQANAYTNVDFPSWERYAGSLGASFHPNDWLDLKIALAHITSPSRDVENGEVYNQVPTSQCQGPEFDSSACAKPGQPPGNPQNEGSWSVNYNIASVGATFHFD